MTSDTAVTASDMSTVFFRPIRFISIPVGTEKIRNQKNTSEGKRFACESESERSFCTKLVPTRSTNPMAKKQNITGISCISELFLADEIDGSIVRDMI